LNSLSPDAAHSDTAPVLPPLVFSTLQLNASGRARPLSPSRGVGRVLLRFWRFLNYMWPRPTLPPHYARRLVFGGPLHPFPPYHTFLRPGPVSSNFLPPCRLWVFLSNGTQPRMTFFLSLFPPFLFFFFSILIHNTSLVCKVPFRKMLIFFELFPPIPAAFCYSIFSVPCDPFYLRDVYRVQFPQAVSHPRSPSFPFPLGSAFRQTSFSEDTSSVVRLTPQPPLEAMRLPVFVSLSCKMVSTPPLFLFLDFSLSP